MDHEGFGCLDFDLTIVMMVDSPESESDPLNVEWAEGGTSMQFEATDMPASLLAFSEGDRGRFRSNGGLCGWSSEPELEKYKLQ
jgi:hypothetical protein